MVYRKYYRSTDKFYRSTGIFTIICDPFDIPVNRYTLFPFSQSETGLHPEFSRRICGMITIAVVHSDNEPKDDVASKVEICAVLKWGMSNFEIYLWLFQVGAHNFKMSHHLLTTL